MAAERRHQPFFAAHIEYARCNMITAAHRAMVAHAITEALRVPLDACQGGGGMLRGRCRRLLTQHRG